MRRLFRSDLRFSPITLALLATVSIVSTVLILVGGGTRTAEQSAALAALRSRGAVVVEHRVVPGAASAAPSLGDGGVSSGAGSSGSTGSGASGAGAAGAAADPAPTPTRTTASTAAAPAPDAGLPQVRHVFLITLSTPGGNLVGHRSALPYVRTLAARGAWLAGLRSLGRGSLADRLAMISGQAPNRQTAAGCPRYSLFPSSAVADAAGLVRGSGCVYPDTALTLADQIGSAGKTWGAYLAGQGASGCPTPQTGAAIDSPLSGVGPQYDLRQNPFAFFQSLLEAGACSTSEYGLSALPRALRRASSTPALTYLGAGACADGALRATTTSTANPTTTTANPTGTTTGTADATSGTADATAGTTTASSSATTATTTQAATTTTATTTTTVASSSTAAAATVVPGTCAAGQPAGPAAENAFLRQWVPRILRSAAYRDGGVIVIAFTGTPSTGRRATGALVLSRWTPRRRRITVRTTPYAVLRSLEDMLDLSPLGHAADASSFAKAVL